MNKIIQNFFIISFLIIGLVGTSLSPAFAADDTSLGVIQEGTAIKVDGNKVNISGLDGDVDQGFSALLNFISLLSGGGALIMLMFFVINFVKLGAAGTNSNARSQAISGLVWSGIATACLSMSTVIFMFFFKMNETVVDSEEKTN